MSVYQLDDFKRLSWLAKELATLKSDDPDLATTLKKCVTAGVSLAIFQHTPINVWRLIEGRRTGNSKPEHTALPISDMGDLEEYEGVLFLTSSCIDALLNAGGEKIRCNEFGCGSSRKHVKAHDELIVASECQVARSMVNEFLAQETRPQRKQKKLALVQTVFPDGGFEECSTEAWLEFSIDDVLVLTRDIEKVLPAHKGKKTGVGKQVRQLGEWGDEEAAEPAAKKHKYDEWQAAVNNEYLKNNLQSHTAICERIARSLGTSPENLRRRTKNPKRLSLS